MSDESEQGTWDERRLVGTKFENITKGSLRYKQLTSREKSEYNTIAMGGIVASTNRPLTREEIAEIKDHNLQARLLDDLPNEPTRDDTMPGDLSPTEAQRLGMQYSRIRDYQGYKIGRDTRFGQWHVLDLPSLGKYTSLQEAEKGLAAYLEKQAKEKQKGQ